MRCIDESLVRLKTDYLDLWQFHEIVYDNDPDWVFEQDGIRAAVEAKQAGKIRHIGFTGHRDPRIHKAMLDKPFDWETVQMPINMMDAQFRSFRNEIVPDCLDRGIGVIGMKTLGGGVITGQAGISADTCIRYPDFDNSAPERPQAVDFRFTQAVGRHYRRPCGSRFAAGFLDRQSGRGLFRQV